jgi:hypothetical protein
MSFITFVILEGWVQGKMQKEFTIETVFYIYSKSMFIWWFEAILMKGIFWIMGFIGNPGFFEWLAYTGYKFVMLCPIVLSHYFLGYWPSYAVMVLLCLCFARFFYMTVK